ncbi:homocysteine S-methyltransferase family protein [Pararhodobacter sp. CCB-MM2]|uniref:homocysteine S-methyltransferase family protein n=1 Tax=Pararhodobacter sp. CCB-MM2 TaxID=1786003 RepID=UPI000832F748|nr:homocysteine S-methyltransferase family protein [Pararhodobacter sp. CCB-MM2]
MTTITLMDGGMGQELVRRSGDEPTPLWATRVMMDHPGMVQAIHADYFAAGASLATTNTYAIHHDRLVKVALDHRFAALYDAALSEAERARDAQGRGLLAGSMGPLVASYRPDTLPPHAEAVAKYAEVAAILAPRVDVLLGESVASLAHAAALIEGARQGAPTKPLWLSVTVDDEDGRKLRSGEDVADLAPLVAGVDAVLANCSAPEAMDQAMPVLARFGKPFGAYANGFTQITSEFLKDSPTVDALSPRPEMTPDRYAEFIMGWVRQGATLVGGCCEIGPAHIAAVAARLRDEGYKIA